MQTDHRGVAFELEQADKRRLWHPFTPQQDWEAEPQLIIDRAEGCYLIDIEGKRYLDGVASLWVNVHGHCHPALNQAITAANSSAWLAISCSIAARS